MNFFISINRFCDITKYFLISQIIFWIHKVEFMISNNRICDIKNSDFIVKRRLIVWSHFTSKVWLKLLGATRSHTHDANVAFQRMRVNRLNKTESGIMGYFLASKGSLFQNLFVCRLESVAWNQLRSTKSDFQSDEYPICGGLPFVRRSRGFEGNEAVRSYSHVTLCHCQSIL